MTISIIAAIAENGVIGENNNMPWNLPADFAYFKEKTLHKTLVIGLNTFESIGRKPLPDRKNIILSATPISNIPKDCFLATSVDQVLEMVKNEQEVMVCGGAMVYKQFLPLADTLYLTFIHHVFEGDAFFPEFNMQEWQEIERKDFAADDKNMYSYSFAVFKRKS